MNYFNNTYMLDMRNPIDENLVPEHLRSNIQRRNMKRLF